MRCASKCLLFLRGLSRLKNSFLAGFRYFLLFCLFCLLPQAWAGNRALEFDGADDQAVSDLGTGLYSMNDFTIEVWTNLSADAQDGRFTVFSGGEYFWGMGRFALVGSNRAVFQCVGPKGQSHEVNVRTADNRGEWVFWALLRQGANLRIYRNSELAGEARIPASDMLRLSSQDGIWIGRYSPDHPYVFKGAIDEVRISNMARSVHEISSAWNNGAGKRFESDANTVSLWHFDEGEGGTAYDFSPSSNDLILGPEYSANCPKSVPGFSFTEPPQDLAILHADFHGHLGLKIRAGISGVDPTDKLRVSLTSDRGYSQTVCKKDAPLPAQVEFVLDLRTLSAANYTLKYQLLDWNDQVVNQVVEGFRKPYDGVPKVGIDENNAIRVDDELFFPVTPWGLYKMPGTLSIDTWKRGKYINSLCGQGWQQQASLAGWKDYLDYAGARGLKVIGPGDGRMWGGSVLTQDAQGKWFWTEVDADRLTGYVSETRDHPALFMWLWDDEPDMSPTATPPEAVRNWTTICHELDPQHLVTTTLMGYTFISQGGIRNAKTYCYPHLVDVYNFDYYPIFSKDKSFEKYAQIIDRVGDFTKGLVPFISCVETADNDVSDGIPAPTAEELRMQIWLNVVHGAKGILWYHYQGPTPNENYVEMARFVDQISRLTPIVLAPDCQRKVRDQELDGGRVDIMTKQYDGKLHVFAVNLNRKAERVKFDVEGISANTTINVIDEDRTIRADNGSFEDSFNNLEVHIYEIPIQVPITDDRR